MKLKDLLFENVETLYSTLEKSIPEDTNVKDFAAAVSRFVANEYGTHNIKPFLEILNSTLNPKEGKINEKPETRQKVVDLKSLNFDLLMSMFGKKPMFGFNLPNPNDSYRSVRDERELNDWKAGIEKKYGNVNIKIDTEAESPWDKIQILDDKFIADKERAISGKAAWLDNDRKAGRSTD